MQSKEHYFSLYTYLRYKCIVPKSSQFLVKNFPSTLISPPAVNPKHREYNPSLQMRNPRVWAGRRVNRGAAVDVCGYRSPPGAELDGPLENSHAPELHEIYLTQHEDGRYSSPSLAPSPSTLALSRSLARSFPHPPRIPFAIPGKPITRAGERRESLLQF